MAAKAVETSYRIYVEPHEREVTRPTQMARGTLPPVVVFETVRDEPMRDEPVRGLGAAVENALIATLTSDRTGNETIEQAYKRKETEVASVFSRLSATDAHTLRVRLLAARTDDLLASAFARLVEARRIRLLSILIAAPRR
jgi:hypothetical protein